MSRFGGTYISLTISACFVRSWIGEMEIKYGILLFHHFLSIQSMFAISIPIHSILFTLVSIPS